LSGDGGHRGAGPLAGIDAVILAGGFGTRLQSVLPDRQKVIGSVAGRPFLHHLLNQFADAGVGRFVLALGHRADQVTEANRGWGRPDVEIVTAVEPTPLGTGGALRHALSALRSDTLLVANGDSFAGADLAALLAFHRARRAHITLLLVQVRDAGRYGRVQTDADGAVLAFEEKPANAAGSSEPAAVNGGIYLMDRTVVAAIPAGRTVSLEREIFPAAIGKGLYGHLQAVPFIDIGTPESWSAAAGFFAALNADVEKA
jgi:NDP-sugar pyrophosphorylase family protein